MGLIDTWEKATFVPLDWVIAERASTYQGKMFHLIKFLRQSVYLTRGIVYFSQTKWPCRGIKAYLITLTDVTSKHERNDWQLLLWLIFPFKIGLAFYGWSLLLWKFLELSRNWGISCENTCYKFLTIISFALLQSSRFNLHVYFRLFCPPTFTEMPSLNRYEKVTCENCGTQTTKLNLARHKKSCSAGTLYCTHCPNFSTKSQNDVQYHIANKHSAPKPDITFKCTLCYAEFPDFYALRQHENTQHGMQIGSRTKDVDVEHIVEDVEDQSLREELRSCQHFLADSQLERARHKVFKYAVETLNETIVNEKFDHFFNNLKCAAKVNLPFGFFLKNIEDEVFRCFYAHKNNTLLDRSNFMCTHDDLAKLKDCFSKTDVIEFCSRERMNTKWRFYKLTKLTVFAALLEDVPMGCKNAVLPEPLLKNHTINCLTFEESTWQPYNINLCLFRALTLHLQKKHLKFSFDSSIKWMDWAPINSKESIWTIFLLLKIC